MAASAADAAGWTDRRRSFWLVSLLLPMLPLAGVLGWFASGGEAWLWLTPAVVYGLVPLLDQWLGEDPNNPPEDQLPALERDAWYRWLTWLTVPAVWATVCVAARAAARGGTGPCGWRGRRGASRSRPGGGLTS